MEPSLHRTLAAVALGIAFDLAVNQQAPGVSVPLLVAASAVAVRQTSPRTRERDALLGLAVAISPIAALRSEPVVVGPCLLTVAALFVLAATGPGAARLGARSLIGRALGTGRALLRSPAFLTAPARGAGRWTGERTWSVLRATAVAVPVVVVFAMLFASADAVFADTLMPNVSFRFETIAGHLTLATVGTWIAGGWWPAEAAAAEATPPNPETRTARLAPAEWTAALAALTVLFAIFVAVQFAFLFGGRARVEVTPGLTYAEYARSGFFQLLAVGGLTAAVVVAAWDHGRRDTPREERRFLILCSGLAVLCLIVLASAATRLALYQQAFGFTTSRLAAWLAIVAVGAVLCGLVAAIATRRRAHVFSGILAIGLITLLVSAALSPSAFVARRNIERFERTGAIDVPYLTMLGPEATPALVALLPSLEAGDRALLRDALCSQWSDPPGGWRSWNLARARAADAVATLSCA